MNAVATISNADRAQQIATTTPADLLRLAIEQKADPTYMRELMVLQRDWEANEARKAYVSAMAAFKAEPLSIVKDKRVAFSGTAYTHATIGNVVGVICGGLGRHGFSHRWNTEQPDGNVVVTCIITHELGHSESTSLTARPDDSGKKNSIQQIASTISYLERYTLLAATGMATSDQPDDDAASYSTPTPVEPISESQYNELIDLCAAASSPVAEIAAALKVETLRDLPAVKFAAVKKRLGEKAVETAKVSA